MLKKTLLEQGIKRKKSAAKPGFLAAFRELPD